MLRLLTKPYQKLGLIGHSNDPVAVIQARNLIIYQACYYGNTQCLKQTRIVLQVSLAQFSGRLPPDHEGAIICGALRNNDTLELFDAIVAELHAEQRDVDRRERLIDGLSCASNTASRQRLAELLRHSVMEKPYLWTSADERYRLWSRISKNGKAGAAMAFDFIVEYFEDAVTFYGAENMNLAAIRIAQTVGTFDQKEKVR